MDLAGTFPFGWIKGPDQSNWQILWNKNTGDLFLKSVNSQHLKVLNNFNNWQEAKHFADKLVSDPGILTK